MVQGNAGFSAEHPGGEGLRDTAESIVIALILAFVFRAFVVEAFIIPTGSMAPTLYGAHGTIVCSDCGTEFAYGLRDPDDQRPFATVGRGAYAVCPNCRHANTDLPISDERGNPETGDRILVMKWPFDLGWEFLGPQRWDVTVFKDPADGVTNFIKRLVGMPNEVLVILDGDAYAVPMAELSAASRDELAEILREKSEFQVGDRRGTLRAVSANVRRELERKLRICRKSPRASRSLWLPVYNHDRAPVTLDAQQPRWEAPHGDTSGWSSEPGALSYDPTDATFDYVLLGGKPIQATNAYNVFTRTPPAVSDLRVRFVVSPRSADGAVSVRLEKLGRGFWATWHFNGGVELHEDRDKPGSRSRMMTSAPSTAITVGSSVEVSFELVDYRLSVCLGGSEVLTSSDDPASPAYYAPDLAALRQIQTSFASAPPRIYGNGGSFDLYHVVVERDEYYYHDAVAQALALSWAPRDGWATLDHPVWLRENEYFMLGDNTSASKDSRLWDMPNTSDPAQTTAWGRYVLSLGERFQLGTVTRDQLVGRAFFVYWPAAHRMPWLPGLRFGIVPDIGRMRWIQ